MLVRSLCRCAASRPRHTWMALMVEECGVMPLTTIAPLVQHSFDSSRNATAEKAATSTTSVSAAAPPGRAPEERAHAWVAVARLLCEGGDWARAAAVVEGLPPGLQRAARLKAVRDDWPLPRSLQNTWRSGMAAETSTAPVQPLQDDAKSVQPSRTSPSDASSLKETAASVKASQAAIPSPVPAQTPVKSLSLRRTDELVRMAYSLRKAPPTPSPRASSSKPAQRSARETSSPPLSSPPSSSSASAQLQRNQQSIFAELRKRDAVAEAVQCVVNWQRRQLLRPDAETMGRRAIASDDEAMQLFDGLGAVKFLLFPAESGQAVGVGAASAFTPAGAAGEPPRYSASQLRHVRATMSSNPTLVARCLRDRAAGERLLRYGGDASVVDYVFAFLKQIAEAGGKVPERAGARPRSSVAGTARGTVGAAGESPVASLETYWRAVATLLPLLHSYWRRQPKSEKEKLLRSLLDALSASEKRNGSVASASQLASAKAQAALSSSSSDSAAAEISEKTRRAMKASVESACSPLLHHEPQIRFLRLALFGGVAQALAALHVPLPNALVQCLFLCMADTFAPTTAEAVRDDSPLQQYLFVKTTNRWLAALALLRAAERNDDFRVTAAHTRAVLGGLQSISITDTWPSALRVVAECQTSFGVSPDERTLPTLLLNLKQQSWQDAFRVLQFVPNGDPSSASPLVLRDLQLVALKHASWEVPLRLMTHLQRRHADGFMNYVYCLCAAARGGQAEVAFRCFASLRLGRGRHASYVNVSPYNELTVAVAAVAMLDRQHYAALAVFAQRVLTMRTEGVAVPEKASAGRTHNAASVATSEALTHDGYLMAHAAGIAALLHEKRSEDLVKTIASLPEKDVQPVFRRLVTLHCLLNMDHLNAPVRLVFDVLGYSTSSQQSFQQQHVHGDFLNSVEAAQRAEGTFETRQRTTSERRRHLFIPMSHQRQQSIAVARLLGGFMKEHEAALPPQMVRHIAETMAEAGVGTEYLTAALL